MDISTDIYIHGRPGYITVWNVQLRLTLPLISLRTVV